MKIKYKNLKNKYCFLTILISLLLVFNISVYAQETTLMTEEDNIKEYNTTKDNKKENAQKEKESNKNIKDASIEDIKRFTEVIPKAIAKQKGINVDEWKTENIKIYKYSEFERLLKGKSIESVLISPNYSMFEFKLTNGEYGYTLNPNTEEFRSQLVKNNILVENINDIVNYNVGVNSGYSSKVNFWDVLLIVTIIYFVYTIFSNTKTSKNTSWKKDVEVKEEENKVTFDDVRGIDELKKDIHFIVDFLKNPEKYEKVGAKMPKGIILYGPPGTGKTLTAKAIAGEAGVPFYSVNGSDFVEKYVGVGAKRVRDLYKKARANGPCIVFIDEIDAVGSQRGTGDNTEKDQTLNALLSELDGFSEHKVITIAATNRLELLDNALIRPGRFDKHLAVMLPDYKSRLDILEIHAEGKVFEDDVTLEDIAKITVNFSGAGLEALLNEAAFLTAIENKEKISKEIIDRALFKQLTKGDIKDGQEFRRKDELELVAWHEAGHALLTKLLTNDEVNKVTILASTSGAGGVTFSTPEDISLYSKKYIESKIAIMYGGRIAEYLLLGDDGLVTTGASNDIQQATRLIKGYINNYGMSNTFGMLNIEEMFGVQSSQLGANELVLQEAKNISENIYNNALKILTDNKDILEAIATELLEKETIDNNRLDDIIAEFDIVL